MLYLVKKFDYLHCVIKTEAEENRDQIFRKGDYYRLCTVLYLITRKLIDNAVFLIRQENKKRIQPRHLLTAAVLS